MTNFRYYTEYLDYVSKMMITPEDGPSGSLPLPVPSTYSKSVFPGVFYGCRFVLQADKRMLNKINTEMRASWDNREDGNKYRDRAIESKPVRAEDLDADHWDR